MSRMVVYLVAASVLIAWASAACNTQVATELASGDCNCTIASQVYDYRENLCKNMSVLYPSGGYGPFGDADGCYEGYTMNDTTRQCYDDNECALSTTYTCAESNVCYNTLGHYYCACGEQLYRPSGSCVNLNEARNPFWNDCPQIVYDWTPGYRCSCFNDTMFNNTMKDGRSCELYPGYTDCTKDTDTNVMCVEESATSQQFFFPMQGYKLNDNNELEDINECLVAPGSSPLCWEHADCHNQEGGYVCTCQPGYENTNSNNQSIRECLPKKCHAGEGRACVDACDNFECPQDEYCVIENNLPTCKSQLADTIFGKPITENVFANSIVIWNPNESPGQVTQSLEMVFGAGRVQLLPRNTRLQEFNLNVLVNMAQDDVNERLYSHCTSLSQLPDYCELPGGVIIQVTTNFTLSEVVCATDTCPEDTHNCDVGTRTCSCKEEGNGTYTFNGILETCQYQLSGCEGSQSTTVEASSTEQVSQATTLKASSTEQVSQTTTLRASSTEQVSQTTTLRASSTEQVSSTSEGTNWRDVATDLQSQLDDAEDALKVTAAVLGTLLGLALVVIVVLVFFKKGRFFSS